MGRRFGVESGAALKSDKMGLLKKSSRALEIVRGSKPTRDPSFRIRSPVFVPNSSSGILKMFMQLLTGGTCLETFQLVMHTRNMQPLGSINQQWTIFLTLQPRSNDFFPKYEKNWWINRGTSGTPPSWQLSKVVLVYTIYPFICPDIDSTKWKTENKVATKMHCVKPYVAPCQESPHFTPLLDLNLTQYFTQLHPSELLIRYGSSSTKNRLGKFNIL
ncbi:hypothetical protein H6P81_017686 [Aristolochia fimbriata]|uniref:Uncharacterized protein n=1 Tax=Aristolochia fimbriata TaxID=158543 RepID=A0AAV7DZD4_ARIFI|nr:hypothetical protein H6P81_017686 [Aristolochia fimbriata]